MSDRALARHLSELLGELKQRMSRDYGRGLGPELDRAVQEARTALKSFAPRRARRGPRATPAERVPEIQEAKRKAVRAALLAGIRPGQVAKHFGLPLTTVRKILSEMDGSAA